MMDFEEYIGPFARHNHMEIVSMSPEQCIVKVELRPESKNLFGFAHGGLMGGMADCAAGIAARADGDDFITINCSYCYLRNVTSGTIYAQADTVKRGGHLIVFRVSVYDDAHEVLMEGLTEMTRVIKNHKKQLSPFAGVC